MAVEPQSARVSVDEYLRQEEASDVRHEYIDGCMYLMPGGTVQHAALGVAVGASLRSRLRGTRCRVCSSDVRVLVEPDDYLYPGVTVACDERDQPLATFVSYPRVIVEVLSKSTEASDRGAKFKQYRSCDSLEEYVLVNSRETSVEVYRRSGDFWTYHTYSAEDDMELMSLGLRFPVAEIYEGIEARPRGRAGTSWG